MNKTLCSVTDCRKTSSVDKKGGCRVLLALLVLHRAKLLASNQSILALGRSPRQGLGAVAPVKSPFPGERGQGDRDSKLEVCFKNRLFLQAETLYSVINIIIIYSRPLCKAKVSTLFSQGRSLGRHIAVDCVLRQ